jgi:RNA polymerase sigma-70 factor, ECF subfamily
VPLPPSELERIYCQCRQQLFTCALAITGSPAQAEDAVHDAFCQLLRRQAALNDAPAVDLKAYAFRAVRNAAIDRMRQKMKTTPQPLPDFIFDPTPDQSTSTEASDFQRQVVELLGGLSVDERETIVQHVWGELTFQEIAVVREAPLGTIASWYRRGLEKLRHELEVADGTV